MFEQFMAAFTIISMTITVGWIFVSYAAEDDANNPALWAGRFLGMTLFFASIGGVVVLLLHGLGAF